MNVDFIQKNSVQVKDNEEQLIKFGTLYTVQKP